MPRPGRLDYGWAVVAGLCVTETVSWGIIYYGFPVMLRPMEAELGFSRAEITGAFSAGLAVAALAGLPVGRWIDRHGARSLMTVGSILATALVVLWASSHTLLALYSVWILMGLAMAAVLYEPAFAAIVGWFPARHRDRALLAVTIVAGFASTIFMPIEAWLLVRFGWRQSLLMLAAVLAVITIPIHVLVLRRPPHAARPRDGAITHDDRPGVTLSVAARTAVFWVLAAAFFAGNFTTNSVTVHVIPYLSEHGYSPTVAAVTIGWMGAMQVPARIFFAPIAARFGHGGVTAAIFFMQAAAMVQLALVSYVPTLVPMIVMQGAANGMATLARATAIAAIFGPLHYGSIAGAIALGANGARAFAPVGASLLRDALGSYEAVFWLMAALLVVAATAVALTLRLGRPVPTATAEVPTTSAERSER